MARKLVIASNNKGKIAELTDLLAPLGLQPVAQGELGVSEAEEPAVTFVENAIIKARHAARVTGLPALADDSGLAVDALDGRPGVRSAASASARLTASATWTLDAFCAEALVLSGVPQSLLFVRLS